jgi:hypothetical protein
MPLGSIPNPCSIPKHSHLDAANLSGNKEAVKQMGAGSSEVSAQTVLSIIE